MSEQAYARARARATRDKLAAHLLGHPDVTMVDIGQGEGAEELVVQVHIRPVSKRPPEIPAELDGIPVRIVQGEYRLER